MPADAPHRLQCLEVWGGNRAVSTALDLPGLYAWLYSLPAGDDPAGGGDVHYLSSCAAGAVTRMLLADVAGHGTAAVAMAQRLRRLMQRHIIQHNQARFIRAVNREFATLTTAGRFATALAFTYDWPVNRLLVSNAGHPAPLIYHHRDRTWQPLEHTAALPRENLPLGIEHASRYDQFEYPIDIGDLVLCYTDGLLEARSDDARMLGPDNLLALLAREDPARPADLIPRLLASIASDGWTFTDDLTILLFCRTPTPRARALRDTLLLPVRGTRAIAYALTR